MNASKWALLRKLGRVKLALMKGKDASGSGWRADITPKLDDIQVWIITCYLLRTEMKRKFIAVIVFTCMLLVAVAAICLSHKRSLSQRVDCLSCLRSTGWALGMYCSDHEGHLPRDFSLMRDGNYLTRADLYVCPWRSKQAGSWTNITVWMDYFYIPWPSITGAYTKYPLMYDRRLANHGGKGINILLAEQAVHPASPPNPETFHGQFFWDEDAKWLRKFAREHPDLKIPMPEDIK
jgi:hypothetical protein